MERIITTIWDGWNVTKDGIYTPEGVFFRPGEIRAIPIHRALISEYQCMERLRRTAAKAGGLRVINFKPGSAGRAARQLKKSG